MDCVSARCVFILNLGMLLCQTLVQLDKQLLAFLYTHASSSLVNQLEASLFVSQVVETCVVLMYLQAVLSLWRVHPTQPLQYVRELHTIASRHHRGPSEAGHYPVVQGV